MMNLNFGSVHSKGVTRFSGRTDLSPSALMPETIPSPLPEAQVIIVDGDEDPRFSKCVDIDGDGAPCLTHSETIRALIKGFYPNVKFVNNIYLRQPLDGVFKDIAERIDKGQHVDAINMSLEQSFQFTIQDLANLTCLPLTADKLKQYQPQILERLKHLHQAYQSFQQKSEAMSPKPPTHISADAAFESENYSEILNAIQTQIRLNHSRMSLHSAQAHAIQLIKQVEDNNIYSELQAIANVITKGVPVFIGGGNDEADGLNLFNLASGAINVGANDVQGKRTPYTAQNSLMSAYAQGNYTSHKVVGGFQITPGKAHVDVLTSETTQGKPIIEQFVGKPLSEVLANGEDIQHLMQLARLDRPGMTNLCDRLLSLPFGNLLIMTGIPERIENSRKRQAKALREQIISRNKLYPVAVYTDIAKNTKFKRFVKAQDEQGYVPFNSNLIINADQQGLVRYDPDHSGRADAVSEDISGTSFAAPTYLAQYLRQTLGAKNN